MNGGGPRCAHCRTNQVGSPGQVCRPCALANQAAEDRIRRDLSRRKPKRR